MMNEPQPVVIAEDARVEAGAVLGSGTRVWHLAHVRSGATVGSHCVIGGGAFVDAGVIIGSNCKIQNAALIYAPARIGDGVFVGPGVILTNDRLPRAVEPGGRLKSAEEWSALPVVVADGASIGAGAVVVAGVNVGRWAMVAAGAVVTRDVADHELVAGAPATHLGWIDRAGQRLQPEGGLWRASDGKVYRRVDTGMREVES